MSLSLSHPPTPWLSAIRWHPETKASGSCGSWSTDGLCFHPTFHPQLPNPPTQHTIPLFAGQHAPNPIPTFIPRTSSFGAMKTSSLHHRFQLVLGLITGIGLHTAVADPILDLRTRSWYGSTFPNSVNAMAAESNRLHVVTGPQGLSIIDISNPWLPSRKGGVDTDGDARDVTVAQGFAYIADDRNGLVIVDVRDGDHPVIRSRYPTTGSAWSVAFLNSTVFVADSVRGLLAIDVRDPDHPVLAHQFSTPQPIQDLAVQGDLVLAATGLDGLRAFRFPASGTPSEAWHLPDPTPFPSASNRGITHVAAGPGWAAFSLPTSSDIRILDLTSNDGPRLSVHLLTNSGVKSLEGAGDDLLIADNLFTTWKFRITGRQASYSHTLDDRDLGDRTSVV